MTLPAVVGYISFSSLSSLPSPPLSSMAGPISFTSSSRCLRFSLVDVLSRLMIRMRLAARTSRPGGPSSLVDGSASSAGCEPLRSVTPLMLLERIECGCGCRNECEWDIECVWWAVDGSECESGSVTPPSLLVLPRRGVKYSCDIQSTTSWSAIVSLVDRRSASV